MPKEGKVSETETKAMNDPSKGEFMPKEGKVSDTETKA
jgi:hypothetical protein